MSSLKRRIWKFIAAMLAGVVILLAIGVGLFRAAIPYIPALSAQTEQVVEDALGWPLRIGQMDLRWQFIGPMLVLTDVELLAPNSEDAVISVARIDVIFRPGDLLQESDFRPAHIRLHQPRLGLARDAENRIWLSGHLLEMDTEARVDWRTLLRRGLKHGRLSIIDGTIRYRDVPLGIESWTVRNFNVTAASDGFEHEFKGSFLPPGPLGEQAAFALEATGPAGEPENWQWNAELGARKVRFNWLYEQLRWAGPGRFRGTIDVSADLGGKGFEEIRGEGSFAADDLDFVLAEAVAAPVEEQSVSHIAFDWILESGDDNLTLDLEQLSVSRGFEPWPATRWHIVLEGTENARQLGLRATYLQVGDIVPMLDWLPLSVLPEDARNSITALQPRGEVRDLELAYGDVQGLGRLAFSASDIGFDPWRDYPGVQGLDFSVDAAHEAGSVTLQAEDVTLDARSLFRDVFAIYKLTGQLAWQQSENDTALDVQQLVISTLDATIKGGGSIRIPQDGPVTTALQGKVLEVPLAAASKYLPVEVMKPKLVDWLDEATPAGRIPEADWKLEGALQDFPWADGSGVFDIRFPIQNLTLVYNDEWPRIEDAGVDVHFHQGALDVTARSGTTAGLSIAGVSAGFESLSSARLFVEGPVRGNAADAFTFLRNSPLQEDLRGLLEHVSVDGPFESDVALDIPLKTIDATTADIRASLQGITVSVDGLPWPVEDLAGELLFTRHSISAEQLAGTLTGNPLEARISSSRRDDGIGRIEIDAHGKTPITAVAGFLPPGWGSRLAGRFDWQGQLSANVPDEPLTFRIASGLDGVTSTLPAPLARLPSASAVIRLPAEEGIDTTLLLDGLLAGRLGFERQANSPDSDGDMTLVRGEIRGGTNEFPAMPQQDGLLLTGSLPSLSALEWVLLGEDEPPGDENETARGDLRAIDISTDLLRIGHLEFADQRIAGERRDDAWEFSMQGPIQGAISLPVRFDAEHLAKLNLETLHIVDDAPPDADVAASPEQGEDRAPDPRLLPNVQLDIRDLEIGELDFGHVTGRLQRTAIGFITDDLQAVEETFLINLDGRWEYVGGSHYTSMHGILESSDLEPTLAQLGYLGGLDADDATIDFNLSWPASPAGLEIGIIEGKVSFIIKDGQLREVSPGAGRMIGLFSLSALPRRLLLDFSDLFNEGLAFDELTGDYLITNGNAYTTNVKLDGASIEAWLVGRTGLAAQDYDQVAIVDPGVGATIPVAGYLAAGPTVGAALLLVSQILKSPLSDITQVKYRITGSWDDPVIEEVEAPSTEQSNEEN